MKLAHIKQAYKKHSLSLLLSLLLDVIYYDEMVDLFMRL